MSQELSARREPLEHECLKPKKYGLIKKEDHEEYTICLYRQRSEMGMHIRMFLYLPDGDGVPVEIVDQELEWENVTLGPPIQINDYFRFAILDPEGKALPTLRDEEGAMLIFFREKNAMGAAKRHIDERLNTIASPKKGLRPGLTR